MTLPHCLWHNNLWVEYVQFIRDMKEIKDKASGMMGRWASWPWQPSSPVSRLGESLGVRVPLRPALASPPVKCVHGVC